MAKKVQKSVGLASEVWDCLAEIARRHVYGSSSTDVARTFILARLHQLQRRGRLRELGVTLDLGEVEETEA